MAKLRLQGLLFLTLLAFVHGTSDGAVPTGFRDELVTSVGALDEMLSKAFEGTQPGLAEENIQSRLRMVTHGPPSRRRCTS